MKNRNLLIGLIIFALICKCSADKSSTDRNPKGVRIAGIVLKWVPKNSEQNFQRAEKLIRQAAAKNAKIICTTESFLDGYSARDASMTIAGLSFFAEKVPGGKYVSKLQQLADELEIYLIAGITELDNNKIYNSAVLIGPDGNIIGKYRKKYLYGNEIKMYTPGEVFPVFPTPYGKIGMMICYDRRMDDSIRELTKNGAEIVFCLAGGGFGIESDQIMSLRSKEGKVLIIFVHPAEFLVTDKSGNILERYLFGTELDENAECSIGGKSLFFDLHPE
jgi:apolipoprotein N-acyltransferase